MHKYFNFLKIFEAEQMGQPLDPQQMGTPMPAEQPTTPTGSTPSDQAEEMPAAQSTVAPTKEPVVANFEELAKTHVLNALFTKAEIAQLERDGTLKKADAEFRDKTTSLNAVTVPLKISITGRQTMGSQDDPDAIAFVIDNAQFKEMKDGMVGGSFQSEFATTDTETPVSVNFNLDQSLSAQPTGTTVVAPSDSQLTAGAIPPLPVEGSAQVEKPNESVRLFNFNQFVNEAKKEKWIGGVVADMKKGALRKEMGLKKGEKMDLSDIAKSEAKLKKKDKDKKKPGLQLDKKDAKTHKRNTLAKNLIKASKGK